MKKMLIATSLLFTPLTSQADSDSEFRAEILGEQDGKIIATDHGEYQPENAKKACEELFAEKWENHFKEQGFDTDDATVNSYVAGCMKMYSKKIGTE